MTPNQKPAFFALLADVHAFYRRDFSDFAGRVWWEAMKRFDLEQVSQAMSAHCINPDGGQFMPMPADLVGLLGGNAKDQAFKEWAKAEIAFSGSALREPLDDISLQIIDEMGGVRRMGQMNVDQMRFVAKDFMDRYVTRSRQQSVPDAARLASPARQAIEHQE